MPHLNDPDMCHPFSTSAWEFALLLNHFHPGVRHMARQVSGVKASAEQEGTSVTLKSQDPSTITRQFASFQTNGFTMAPSLSIPPRIQANMKRFRKKPILDGPEAYK